MYVLDMTKGSGAIAYVGPKKEEIMTETNVPTKTLI
jgi:hypothetical protein